MRSRRKYIRAIILALTWLMTACTIAPRQAQPLHEDLVLQLEQPPDLPAGSVYLKSIAGGLQGKAGDEELLRVLPVNDRLRITTRLLVEELAKQARPVAASRRQPGELVTPRTARFARVATFFEPVSVSDGCNNFVMGLRGERRSGQLLVYVDRAAAIVGTHYRAPYIFDYDLRFPRAGLYVVGLRRFGYTLKPFIVQGTGQLIARIRAAECTAAAVATAY